MFMLIAMPIFGINQGAQPIIGYNYGACRFDRVEEDPGNGHPGGHGADRARASR